jgi:8-oxo-dGTP pyrophosphatase MutT (NUDIX family)
MISKGHVEQGENLQDAALREAVEELGLIHSNLIPTTIKQCWHGNVAGLKEHYVMTVYMGQVKDANNFAKHDYEIAETRWTTSDEFMLHGRDLHKQIVNVCASKVPKFTNMNLTK